MIKVWKRRRVDGRPEEELLPTRDHARQVGTAYAHLYLEPEEVEVDAAYVIMRDELLDECGPTVHAVVLDLDVAFRVIGELNQAHLIEMARRHGKGFGAVTEWRVDVIEIIR